MSIKVGIVENTWSRFGDLVGLRVRMSHQSFEGLVNMSMDVIELLHLDVDATGDVL